MEDDDDVGIEAFKRARQKKLGAGLVGTGGVALALSILMLAVGGAGTSRTTVYIGALGLAGAGMVVFGFMKLAGKDDGFSDMDDDIL